MDIVEAMNMLLDMRDGKFEGFKNPRLAHADGEGVYPKGEPGKYSIVVEMVGDGHSSTRVVIRNWYETQLVYQGMKAGQPAGTEAK